MVDMVPGLVMPLSRTVGLPRETSRRAWLGILGMHLREFLRILISLCPRAGRWSPSPHLQSWADPPFRRRFLREHRFEGRTVRLEQDPQRDQPCFSSTSIRYSVLRQRT
ncbi:hypothetical protein NW754_16793 [Fusarium falciforme]|nr:hypothetical protein NW754_16793 [Fusarium falciforme]